MKLFVKFYYKVLRSAYQEAKNQEYMITIYPESLALYASFLPGFFSLLLVKYFGPYLFYYDLTFLSITTGVIVSWFSKSYFEKVIDRHIEFAYKNGKTTFHRFIGSFLLITLLLIFLSPLWGYFLYLFVKYV